jgi:hypothetical protein
MLDGLAPTCGARGCERGLDENPALVARTAAAERRAAECDCRHVTVTDVG